MKARSTAETSTQEAFAPAMESAQEMAKYLGSGAAFGATHSELEQFAEREGREFVRRMLQGHYDLRAIAERPVRAEVADSVVRPFLLTTAGRVEVARVAYQARDVEGLHPMDALLNLPRELYSHEVRRRAAEHAACGSFEEVSATLSAATGTPIGKRQVEELGCPGGAGLRRLLRRARGRRGGDERPAGAHLRRQGDPDAARASAPRDAQGGGGHYLAYDAALAAGLPIATGVIEGACRYLVKDRMEKTGARWSLAGAEAVLRLRALRASGDFDRYWALHLDREHGRQHRARYVDGAPPLPVPPLTARPSTREVTGNPAIHRSRTHDNASSKRMLP